MHLRSPDGIRLGRDFVLGLNVVLQNGAELILLLFSARATVRAGGAGEGLVPGWNRNSRMSQVEYVNGFPFTSN
jgi:hypothetical protein